MLDPKDSNSWLQLGILLMQRQEPRMWQRPEPLTIDFRRKTLSEAIQDFAMAEKLKPDDIGIRSRLNQAESEKESNEAVAYFNTAEKLKPHGGVRSGLTQVKFQKEALQ